MAKAFLLGNLPEFARQSQYANETVAFWRFSDDIIYSNAVGGYGHGGCAFSGGMRKGWMRPAHSDNDSNGFEQRRSIDELDMRRGQWWGAGSRLCILSG